MAQVELAISTWASLCAPSGINIGAGTDGCRAQIAVCSVVGRLARVVVQEHGHRVAVAEGDCYVYRRILLAVYLGDDEMPLGSVALVVCQ